MTNAGSQPDFVELAQFEIDERSVRLLAYEYCLEKQVVVLGVVDRAISATIMDLMSAPRPPAPADAPLGVHAD